MTAPQPDSGRGAWRVFYVDIFGQPVFAERISEQPGFEIRGIETRSGGSGASISSSAQIENVLSGAHVYQVSSGVNDHEAQYLAGASLLDRTPNLLLVSTIGAGYDTVDVAECTRRGVAVVNQSGGANAQAVVEHTLGMMIALGKRIGEADRAMRATPNVVRGHFTGRNLQRKTVGIIGFGNVGKGLANICRAALDMHVLVSSEHSRADSIAAIGAKKTRLDELLEQSDYVVICCALTDATRGMIGADQFSRMKPGAYFVTTARGGIHDESALVDALRGKRIAGAGIDVWDVEPPPLDHPLLRMPNVIATPHTGGATFESRIEASENAAAQIIQALGGTRPANLLNPDVWPAFLARRASLLSRR